MAARGLYEYMNTHDPFGKESVECTHVTEMLLDFGADCSRSGIYQ